MGASRLLEERIVHGWLHKCDGLDHSLAKFNGGSPSDRLLFGVFSKLVCMRVPLYSSSNLVCLANERGLVLVWFGILNYRVLHLSLGCDSWYACYAINLVK